MYDNQGKYAQAEPLYQRALKIDEKALGPDHPSVGRDLNNLAELYRSQGQYSQAEPLYQRALKIDEQALGPDHPYVANDLNNLSVMQAALDQWPDASSNTDRARRGIRRHVARELPGLSAKDQLTFLQVTDERQFHGALSLGLNQRTDETIAVQSAAWLTNGKAVAQEALTLSALLARESNDPSVATTIKQLLDTRRQLAGLVMGGSHAGQEAQRREQLEHLQAQEVELSRQVTRATEGRILAEPWVEVDAVRKGVPVDGVLIDIARFNVFNFQAKGTEKKFQPAHYAAWLVPPAGKGNIQIIDLGEADKIDAAVQAVRKGLDSAIREMQAAAAKKKPFDQQAQEKLLQPSLADLAQLVLEPVLKQIPQDTKQLILSPDASLWLVPWGALPLKDGKYAIEQYQLRYLVSGRDLVAQRSAKLKPTQPIVMANPNYDLGPGEVATATRSVLRGTELASNDALRSLGPAMSSSVLPKSRPAAGHGGGSSRYQAQAGESDPCGSRSLTWINMPRKGYSKRSSVRKWWCSLRMDSSYPIRKSCATKKAPRPVDRNRVVAAPVLTVDGKPVENPLLRCGLLLAGCNASDKAPTDADDGILTGMEIVGTDLRGTELVVLSACETGLGQVHNGEGVAGLRQAFQLAGAQSVVATLWQIPDKDSAQLMSQFFTNLAAGQSKADALRNAQLAQMDLRRQRYGAAHPFFWAAFTITGE